MVGLQGGRGGKYPPKQLGNMYVEKYIVLVGEVWYDV